MAQGIVLNNEELRTDLNWLNQQGVIQISTSTWPLSGDEIERALNHAKVLNNTQQKVIDSVKAVLNKENTAVKFDLSIASDQAYSPQQFGTNAKAQYVAGVELNAGQAHWDARLKVNAEKDQVIDHGHDINIEGSYIAGKLRNQWLIAGQIPTYWGPGYEGSLIRGDASRPVYGLTMQRAEQKAFETKWLSWIGDWQYQIFAGQLDNYEAIPNAKLLGLRLTMQPRPYLEIGASRILQWGGDGKDESLSGLWEAIKGNDNFDDRALDKSNQLAGIDIKLNLKHLIDLPLGIYGQLIGEDEAGYLPSRKFYLLGVDYSSELGKLPFQLYLELADTRTNREVWGYTYSHGDYKDGYYQHGFPLGHSLGGDSEMYSIGGNIRIDLINRLSGRALFATVNQSNLSINEAFPNKDEIKALDLTWTHYLKPTLPLEIKAWVSDSDLHGRDTGASVGIEIPLDSTLFKH
ncbi:capsule assembly Wzi family protein [Acinetobacter wanghuae]|uniref:Capsule assembly Wzi family protein n=1 Tax=Acinetobacter wanghuae TaxID=2662362 RepID=A0A5Q0P7Y6_9GAMM|nr:capsule assembly Wzi family protein [Acinetobacter wanghuae]MQW92621.1 capsule assembly Wzi family protein [Acinetobacter wanghuae]QGA12350.1 capsule assembly Wzi family protein [Acinetobacter wanghuae]